MTLHAIKSPDEELEEQIEAVYQKICDCSDSEVRKLLLMDLVRLTGLRSERKKQRMEQEKMQRIKDGG